MLAISVADSKRKEMIVARSPVDSALQMAGGNFIIFLLLLSVF